MPGGWTDNPVTTNTRIRAVHINELRRSVDNYRFAIGVPRGGWTDQPITPSTRIRAVHLTELRSAIQELWNFHQQGPLPNWSVGSSPNPNRAISAQDVNDLRLWSDLTDPPPPTIGINVDPDFPVAAPSVATLLAAKFEGVRLTARSSNANKNYIAACRAAGLQVVAVVATGDSDHVPTDTSVVLQIYNEPDVMGKPTYRSEVQYAAMYAEWRANYPGYTMFFAGLADGQPEYYANVLNALATNHPDVDLPYAVAVHPYLKSAEEVQALIDAYTALNPAIPAVVTEWNPQANSQWIVPIQDVLSTPGTAVGVARLWNSWYPWSTAQDPSTPGIVDAQGNSTPACTALVGHLGGACP